MLVGHAALNPGVAVRSVGRSAAVQLGTCQVTNNGGLVMTVVELLGRIARRGPSQPWKPVARAGAVGDNATAGSVRGGTSRRPTRVGG